MASLTERLAEGREALKGKDAPSLVMKELISKVFSSRNAIHFAHWKTKSYAEHEALGYLYTAIVNKVDEIVEVYQGKFGLLKNVSCPSSSAPGNITAHVKREAAWINEKRDKISNGNEAISAMVDELEALYLKAIYKLENLS